MARPVGELGYVNPVGESWIGFYHRRELNDEGVLVRRKKQHRIGARREMSKAEARVEFTRWLSMEVSEARPLSYGSTLNDAWAIHRRKYSRTSDGQRDAMESIWRQHLEPSFGSRKIRSIAATSIEAVFDRLAAPAPGRPMGYSPSLRDKARDLMRALFARAVVDGVINRSPMDDAYIRIEGGGGKPGLTATEVRAIREQLADEDDRLKFDMCWMLGIDRSPLRAIRLNDITPDGIRIDEGRVEGKKTNLKNDRRNATIAVPKDMQDRLEAKAAARRAVRGDKVRDDEWLFPAIKGNGPFDARAWMENVIRPASVRAGVKKHVDFRTLRRTAGSLLRKSGARDEEVAGVLRNSVATALEYYSDPRQAPAQRAALEASWKQVMLSGRVM